MHGMTDNPQLVLQSGSLIIADQANFTVTAVIVGNVLQWWWNPRELPVRPSAEQAVKVLQGSGDSAKRDVWSVSSIFPVFNLCQGPEWRQAVQFAFVHWCAETTVNFRSFKKWLQWQSPLNFRLSKNAKHLALQAQRLQVALKNNACCLLDMQLELFQNCTAIST